MAKYPVSKGWESKDWQEWVATHRSDAEERLQELGRGEGDPDLHVHEIRKILKRMRAGMRLLCNVVGKKSCETVRGACRDAGRLLSGSRDQAVRLQIFESVLREKGGGKGKAVAAVREHLEREASKAKVVASDQSKPALRLLKLTKIPSERWSGEAGAARLRKSLRRLLKRARTEYLDIHSGYSETFHELRKRVKDLYYVLAALPVEVESEAGPAAKRLKSLSDTLGVENDIAVLLEWFEAEGYSRDKNPELWKPFLKREQTARALALEEGQLLEELSKLKLFRRS